jgi:hypothetical protein
VSITSFGDVALTVFGDMRPKALVYSRQNPTQKRGPAWSYFHLQLRRLVDQPESLRHARQSITSQHYLE